MHAFSPFQACKTLQRLAKRFNTTPIKDPRLIRLIEKCASLMPSADGVSVSRALWALSKLGIAHQGTLDAAVARLPIVLADCGPITMAIVWNAFEAMQVESAECLDFMADEVIKRLHECDPPEVAIVLHAAAQLQFSASDRLFTALLQYTREKEGTFSLRHLAVCLHAAARASVRDETLCRLVVARFSQSMGESDTIAITSAVYACGLIAYYDEPFLARSAEFMERCLAPGGRGLETQQAANMVYAYGKLGFCPERALHAVAQHAISEMSKYKDQELSNLTYGFGLLKFKSDPFLASLSHHLTEDGRVAVMDTQSLVSIAYAYGLLGHCHHTTLRAIGDRCIPMMATFKPEEFSILVYSFGLVNFRHHDFLTNLVIHAPAVFPRFSTQNLSNMLHGLGLVGFDRDDDFIRAAASHLATRLPECTPQDISNPVTALMRLTIPHDGLLRAIVNFVTAQGTPMPLSDFTTQEIANTVYAFDALQFFDRKLFELAAIETERRLEEYIPQEVANIIWAFSKQSFGTLEWYERVLARCAPHAESLPRGSGGHTLATEWCGEDLEKPLGALWPMRDQIPSYARLEKVFRARFLDRIADFLRDLDPLLCRPNPARYQKDFAAWDLYQVGPLFTEELFAAVGIERIAPCADAVAVLLDHYIGEDQQPSSLLSRFGQKMLISVLPAARWVSCHVKYKLFLEGPADGDAPACEVKGSVVVEAAHPKEDEDSNQRRFSAESWREPVDVGVSSVTTFRPVLLSTFLGNWRHRHTELVALDLLVGKVLEALAAGRWLWCGDGFWSRLTGQVEVFVPHTPCLSCLGAFAQLRRWAPRLSIRVSYEDWRDWRRRLLTLTKGGQQQL
eukprot:TRINITY_DN48479_c0_g1_i1.p1 TRINITY_DN48479_c0_g1~~TRINITY_DN48479_c0_g1_i1.p1  ORF type:complete len:956 (-),score=126.90 TRINITY_DN48479_c0_g1_i1:223-2772(-)